MHHGSGVQQYVYHEIQIIVWAINGATLCAHTSGPKTTKTAPYGLSSGSLTAPPPAFPASWRVHPNRCITKRAVALPGVPDVRVGAGPLSAGGLSGSTPAEKCRAAGPAVGCTRLPLQRDAPRVAPAGSSCTRARGASLLGSQRPCSRIPGAWPSQQPAGRRSEGARPDERDGRRKLLDIC